MHRNKELLRFNLNGVFWLAISLYLGLGLSLMINASAGEASQTKPVLTGPPIVSLPKSKTDQMRLKAASWLESLDVDPLRLRKEKKMKGKKFDVEYLHSYLHLSQLADSPREKRAYKEKINRLLKITEKPEYHDLNEIGIEQFREDNISYVNACYLMGLFGVGNSAYKEKIKQILPRIEKDMPNRGINQRMAFRFLLFKLGFAQGYELRDLIGSSVIRLHKGDLTVNEIYDITHEIFFLAEFGQRSKTDLDEADWSYLRVVVPRLVSHFMKIDNSDLLAELLVCMKYLGFQSMKEYEAGLHYILDNQNENGSIGRYEKEREKLKVSNSAYNVDIGGYLHTTEVCLWAVAEALNR